MEIAVTDDAPLLRRRPMIEEPCHGVFQTAKVRPRGLAFEAVEVAYERNQLTIDRWPVSSVRLPSFPIERLEQHLRIERVKPELHLHQHGDDAERLRREQRPAGQALHDEECPAQDR